MISMGSVAVVCLPRDEQWRCLQNTFVSVLVKWRVEKLFTVLLRMDFVICFGNDSQRCLLESCDSFCKSALSL